MGSRIENSVLAELAKAPGTISEFCARAHGGHESVERILRRLRKEGIAAADRATPLGGRGKPPLIYSLAQPQ